MRIGIPVIGSSGWQGGVVYVHNLLRALHGAHPGAFTAYLISDDRSADWLPEHLPILNEGLVAGVLHVGERRVTLKPPLTCTSVTTWEQFFPLVDVLFPAGWGPRFEANFVAWIPDFQYHHLPQFSPPDELAFRRQHDSIIAGAARHLVFSSEDAHRDFRTLFPESKASTHVVHFHSTMPAAVFQPDARAVADRYGCAPDYLICSNQFWAHKNHRVVFEAMRQLWSRGDGLQLVCTGSPSDYRDNNFYRRLVDELGRWNRQGQVLLLGLIPREDQVQLLRQARAIVQPSLFEGWSTVVEDGRSVGCPLFMSDIAVHQEQAPPHGRYFPRQDPAALADLIVGQLPTLPRPGPAREQAGRQHTEAKVQTFGRTLFSLLTSVARAAAPRSDLSVVSSSSSSGERPLIATSISLANLQEQRLCVDSWLAMGCDVISLNMGADVAALWKHFPQVQFHVITRDARSSLNRPLIHLDDLLAEVGRLPNQVVGLVPSDVALDGTPETAAALVRLARDAVVCLPRIDVAAAGDTDGTRDLFACGGVFLPRALTGGFPPSPLCLGAPWWDAWLALVPALQSTPLIRWEGPLAFRARRDDGWGADVVRALASVVLNHHERLSGKESPREPLPFLTVDESHLYLLDLMTTLNERTRSYFPSTTVPATAEAAVAASEEAVSPGRWAAVGTGRR